MKHNLDFLEKEMLRKLRPFIGRGHLENMSQIVKDLFTQTRKELWMERNRLQKMLTVLSSNCSGEIQAKAELKLIDRILGDE